MDLCPTLIGCETLPEVLELAGRSPHFISPSAYDTAWLARLVEVDRPLGEGALEWLRAHQLPDGTWGAVLPWYLPDRLVCTLAASVAFAKHGAPGDERRLRRALLALEKLLGRLHDSDEAVTVGFEMIVPILLYEAERLGIMRGVNNTYLLQLMKRRAAKLARLPSQMVNRFVSHAFSSEALGPDNLHVLDTCDLQEVNGSVACSPSATASFLLHVRPDQAALDYLRYVVKDGAVPYVAPIDVFEVSWGLWNAMLTAPVETWSAATYEPLLDFLALRWKAERGIASCADFTPTDGDATSLTYCVLKEFGREPSSEAVLSYEEATHFRCYPLEADASLSTNVHVLHALRLAGFAADHPTVRKVAAFLDQSRLSEMFWLDKWHISPYYTTAHAVIAAAGYLRDDLAANAVGWILETQNANGAWGYTLPTAEETAYCLQALAVWNRYGGHVARAPLQAGAAWLRDHGEPPYEPLWIGKSLYCPELPVRSAILSALALTS